MKKSEITDPEVLEVRRALDISYTYMSTDQDGNGSPIQKAERAAMAYGRVMDLKNWQTNSELYFPLAMSVVDSMLPEAMEYLFMDDDLFSLIPMSNQISYDQANKVQTYIQYVLRSVMDVYLKCLPTIKDAIKLGTGYGIVEYKRIYPESYHNRYIRGMTGAMIRERMRMSKPIYQLSYRYLKWLQVLPSPGGGTSPRDRNWVIVIDYVPDYELEELLKDEESGMTGDYEEIRKATLAGRMNGYTQTTRNLITSLTNENSVFTAADLAQSEHNGKAGRATPILIPIIKYFSPTKQLWLANGLTKIYKAEGNPDPLTNPIIKANIKIDGGEWYNDGLITSSEDMFTAHNIIGNLLVDMLDFVARPRFIQDRKAIQQDLNLKPWGVTDAVGPFQSSPLVPLIQGNIIDQNTIGMWNQIRQSANQATGRNDALEMGGASGVVRGGSGAFESLLATTGAKGKLSSAILEMGMLKDLIELVLMYEQNLIGTDSKTFQQPDFDNQGRLRYITDRITAQDLRNSFKVELVIREKLRNSLAEGQLRFSHVNAAFSIPPLAQRVNPAHALEYLIGDKRRAQWLMAGANPEDYLQLLRTIAEFGEKPGSGGGGGSMPNAQGMGGANGDATQTRRLGGTNQ